MFVAWFVVDMGIDVCIIPCASGKRCQKDLESIQPLRDDLQRHQVDEAWWSSGGSNIRSESKWWETALVCVFLSTLSAPLGDHLEAPVFGVNSAPETDQVVGHVACHHVPMPEWVHARLHAWWTLRGIAAEGKNWQSKCNIFYVIGACFNIWKDDSMPVYNILKPQLVHACIHMVVCDHIHISCTTRLQWRIICIFCIIYIFCS